MSRTDTPAQDDRAASATPDRGWLSGAFDPARDTLPWARDSLSGALDMSRDFGIWLQQWQLLGTASVDSWCDALRTAR